MTSSLEWSAIDAGGAPDRSEVGHSPRLGARWLAAVAGVIACLLLAPGAALAFGPSFIGSLHTVSPVGSTVPANEDVNPYGVAVVRQSAGSLRAGDILVSNFNNSENLQGTGSTIVELNPQGGQSLFAQISPSSLPPACGGSLGLTTALAILPDNYVVVGNLPSSNGAAATAQDGCLIVLNSAGHVVETISGSLINGPWDLTAVPGPLFTTLFVTNVLNGTVKNGDPDRQRHRPANRPCHRPGCSSAGPRLRAARRDRLPRGHERRSLRHRSHRGRSRARWHSVRRRHVR